MAHGELGTEMGQHPGKWTALPGRRSPWVLRVWITVKSGGTTGNRETPESPIPPLKYKSTF